MEENIFVKAAQLKFSLLNTKRDGISRLAGDLEAIGFFDAPASGGNHEHRKGGLCMHSFNVYRNAHRIAQVLLSPQDYKEMKNSLTIVSILHDIGKCGDYGKSLYVPKMIKNKRYKKSDPNAEPEFIQSDAMPYQHNSDLTNIPHSFRSVKIIEKYIYLTEEEEYAILYHDGLYERTTGGFSVIPGHETPLLMILHWSDMWASKVDEKEEKEKKGEEE